MSPLLLDPGATSPQAQFSEFPSGTTTTGEEEPSKKFSMLMREEDIIVSLTLNLVILQNNSRLLTESESERRTKSQILSIISQTPQSENDG